MIAYIGYKKMHWIAITPELILLITALGLLMLGLIKSFNTNQFLSRSAIGGVVISLAVSFGLWNVVPSAINPTDPRMFSGALINDRFSQSFNILFLIMSLFTILSAFRYPNPERENKAEYFALLLLATVGMMFLASAGNMIFAFVALELFSIALYILCGFSAKHGTGLESPSGRASLDLNWNCKASQESAVKYFLTGAFASTILIYGMALIYAGTGVTEIRLLGSELAQNPYSQNLLVYAGMGLLFCGLAFKVSLVPFHAWTPDVYQGAPTPITGFMSVATKAAAFAFIARVFYIALPQLKEIWMPFLFGISIVTMLVGNIAAISQNNVKRMLAFSGIAHAGYLLIGIVANSKDGIASILFYLAVYLFMNIGTFAIVYTIEGEGENANSIYRFKGLAKRKPLLAATMSLFMLSLAGFPPTAGFFGKLYIFVSAIKQGYVLIIILAVIASMISVYFYLRIIVVMYFQIVDKDEPSIEINNGLNALVLVSAGAVLIIGFFPSFLMNMALNSIPY